MVLSRKHFIALAEICADNDLSDKVIYEIMNFCAGENQNFNRYAFESFIKNRKSERTLNEIKPETPV